MCIENKQSESYETNSENFKIVALDSKGRIHLIIFKDGMEYKHQFDIRATINFPDELKKKDFFSMGYPYLITAYYNMISFSSDYGVFLLKIDESLLTQ